MSDVIAVLADFVGRLDPGDVMAMALVGSSADGGLRPDSDLDLLILSRRSLSTAERSVLVNRLLQISGSRAAAPGRPIELTSLRLGDVVPWRYPATRDFLYGEWLREEYLAGHLPGPEPDSNLPVLITSARQHAITVSGPPLDQLLAPVPGEDLHRSLHDGVPALLDNLVGDERNVLLTLARMIVTLETGLIVPKDRAAAVVAPTLPPSARVAMHSAGQGYLGDFTDQWTTDDNAATTAQILAARIASLRLSSQVLGRDVGCLPERQSMPTAPVANARCNSRPTDAINGRLEQSAWFSPWFSAAIGQHITTFVVRAGFSDRESWCEPFTLGAAPGRCACRRSITRHLPCRWPPRIGRGTASAARDVDAAATKGRRRCEQGTSGQCDW